MDIEIKGGLSMHHDITQLDWRTVASTTSIHQKRSYV